VNRRIAAIRIAVVAILTVTVCGYKPVVAAEKPAKRPNFVWIMSEDNSVHYMDLYFKTGAATPRLDELAKAGVVFNHAFSVFPVCSAARSVLATGCYGSRIGTQYHRGGQPRAQLPKDIRPVYEVMREAGYYTASGKKDYNYVYPPKNKEQNWHGGDWKKRDPGQPFFAKINIGDSHESRLHRTRINKNDEAEGQFVMPRHPDTRTFRHTHRAYHRIMTTVDGKVWAIVDDLKKAGVLEDTFVFYFGDHGGVLPGSKGYVYETGLHVPLVVRLPENFRHLVDLKRGTRTDGFVEFTDFGATIMHLAGIKPPSGIDGKPFMGPGISKADLEARDEAFGIADRFDEKYDLVRTLRKGNLKYMRSYQPFNFEGLHNNYRYLMSAYKEWRDLYKAGKLNPVQAQFYEPREPEALYDVVKDPYETVNLAKDPAYADQLKKLRARLAERMKAMPDLSMYPESHLLQNAMQDPVAFGQKHRAEIAELVDIADLSLLPFSEAKARIAAALKSDNPWKRYWGLIVCSCFMKQAESFVEDAKILASEDKNLLVRTRAVEFLALLGAQNPEPALRDILSKSTSSMEILLILNTVVLLKDGKPGYTISIDPATLQIAMRPGYSLPCARFQYIHTDLGLPWSRGDYYNKLYNERKKR
jgi:arylsulfatase A-like enzyme